MNKIKIISIILISLLVTSLIILVNYQEPENITSIDSSKEEVLKDKDIKYYQEYYNNNEIVGHLIIPNHIDVLLTQTDNNEFYLSHSLSKEKSLIGTEFIDYRVNEESNQINIYGHNSKTYKIPFHIIEKYKDENFFNNNQSITLEYKEQKHNFKVVAFKEVTSDYEHMKVNVNKTNLQNHYEKLISNSLYLNKIPYNHSKILVIQTCSYDNDDSYFLLIAIEI